MMALCSGVLGAAGLAGLAYYFTTQEDQSEASKPFPRMSSGGKTKRKNAVIVFGATGKVGQSLVKEASTYFCSTMSPYFCLSQSQQNNVLAAKIENYTRILYDLKAEICADYVAFSSSN